MKFVYRWPTFFERLIYYFLLPDLMAKIVYEIILKVPAITVNQPKQFLFYGLVAIEYLILAFRYKTFRPALAQVSPICLLLIVMIFHGLVIGLWWGNSVSRMAIDTVNVFVVLANVVILSDPRKIVDTAFDRIFFLNRVYAVVMVFLSSVAMLVNSSSVISLGGSTATAISASLIFTEIYATRSLSGRSIVRCGVGLLMLAATVQSWNRTTLVFVGAAVLILFARKVGRMPFKIAYLAMASVMVAAVALAVLPEDSALSRRLTGLEDMDLSARTGSIGEREAESDAVGDKISALGLTGRIFGAGHGASYDVKYTWEWKLDYSNAHYGWVLFYLRYGSLGYLYMGLWIVALMISILRTWRSENPASILVCLLSIWNVGYLGTYGYFSFFIAGVPFVRPASRRQNRPVFNVTGRSRRDPVLVTQ
jgi:O-antigen ligase